MIDLDKLDKEIDELFEKETSNSLSQWLLNKRLGDFNNIIGKGTFVGMKSRSESVFSCTQKANFNQEIKSSPTNPINRRAA